MGGGSSKVDEEKVDENENQLVNEISPRAFTSIDVHGNSILSSVVILLVILSLMFLGYLLLKRYGCCGTTSRNTGPPGIEDRRRQDPWYGMLNRALWDQEIPFADGYDRRIGYRNVEANRLPFVQNQVLPIAAPPHVNQMLPIAAPPPILPLKYANSEISTNNSHVPPIIIQTTQPATPHYGYQSKEHEEFSSRKEPRRETFERLQSEIDKL